MPATKSADGSSGAVKVGSGRSDISDKTRSAKVDETERHRLSSTTDLRRGTEGARGTGWG